MPNFEDDVRPLFQEIDRSHMSFMFDLGNYNDVRTHALAILASLEDGRMPPGGWPTEKIEVFRQWVAAGMPEVDAASASPPATKLTGGSSSTSDSEGQGSTDRSVPSTAEIVSVKIHPAIGIARLGNHPTEFFVGPERPFATAAPPNGFKADDNGVQACTRARS